MKHLFYQTQWNLKINRVAIGFILFSSLHLTVWAQTQSDEVVSSLDHNETIPDVPTFDLEYKSEHFICSPNKLIRRKSHKHLIEYLCIKDISAVPLVHKTDVAENNQRGRDRTKNLRREAQEKEDMGTVHTVQIPQNKAHQPRIASHIAKQQLNDSFYGKYARLILPAKLYASVRPQIACADANEGSSLEDGGSRAGFFYFHSFDNGYEMTLQFEAKFDWNNIELAVNISEISDSSRRLSFIALEKEEISLLYGKYWSAYYDIAQFTDHFMAFGASSSGAFNNQSDGSASGTGRADNILQLHIDKELYSATLQYQLPHSDEDKEYDYGIAGSLLYSGLEDSKVGASVAFGKFKNITENMHAVGIDGDDLSLITGVSYQKEKFTANAVLSYTQNHMNDDEGIYFDGIGAELYLRYDVNENIRLVSGINTLIPTDNDYKGDYKIKRLILSAQYTFGEKTFDDLVYVEVALPGGNHANGERPSTSVAIGLRYLFNFL